MLVLCGELGWVISLVIGSVFGYALEAKKKRERKSHQVPYQGQCAAAACDKMARGLTRHHRPMLPLMLVLGMLVVDLNEVGIIDRLRWLV